MTRHGANPLLHDMALVPDDLPRDLIERFRRARNDRSRAVLEGFHAVKHAIRFNAEFEHACALDQDALEELTRSLAPDIAPALNALVRSVPRPVFAQLAPSPPATGIIAIARRPSVDLAAVLDGPALAPVVLLEAPAHLGNLGAAVRVAAAAGAAAVVTIGRHDPWDPAALRGSAGLHFALPVARMEAVPIGGNRPLIAMHPDGEILRPGILPDDALLAFGSERRGLSGTVLATADRQIALPMRPGVSSLNLASAVAAVLYAWRLGRDGRDLTAAPD